VVDHIWITVAEQRIRVAAPGAIARILRRQKDASVDVPLGDFFGVDTDTSVTWIRHPFGVSSFGRARNSYWRMPFAILQESP